MTENWRKSTREGCNSLGSVENRQGNLRYYKDLVFRDQDTSAFSGQALVLSIYRGGIVFPRASFSSSENVRGIEVCFSLGYLCSAS